MKYSRINRFNTNITKPKKIMVINEDKDFIDEDDEFVDDVDEDDDFNESLNEADGDNDDNEPEPPMDEQKLKIEALKLATNVGKLMNNVTPEDIVKIAGMLAEFIRNNQDGNISDNATDDFADDSEENESNVQTIDSDEDFA
jgi:hypothetical protein